jgi:hypothetical protein
MMPAFASTAVMYLLDVRMLCDFAAVMLLLTCCCGAAALLLCCRCGAEMVL